MAILIINYLLSYQFLVNAKFNNHLNRIYSLLKVFMESIVIISYMKAKVEYYYYYYYF